MQNKDSPLPTVEEWRAVVGYEDYYEVSSLGRVRSLTREIEWRNTLKTLPGKLMKVRVDSNGYLSVKLSAYGVSKTVPVHRLVAKAFVSGYEAGLEVNHKDGIKTNGSAVNLEWVTRSANLQHSHRLGLHPPTRHIPLPPDPHFLVGINSSGEGLFLRTIRTGKHFGILGHSSITDCIKGKRKTASGYKWYYYEDVMNG